MTYFDTVSVITWPVFLFFTAEEDPEEETLKDLLQAGFWCSTCHSNLPKVLPEADACSATLKIPTTHEKYNDS